MGNINWLLRYIEYLQTIVSPTIIITYSHQISLNLLSSNGNPYLGV